jgi:hypothetical protein
LTAKLFAIVIFNAVIAASLLTLILKSLDHDLPSGVEGGLIGGVIGCGFRTKSAPHSDFKSAGHSDSIRPPIPE